VLLNLVHAAATVLFTLVIVRPMLPLYHVLREE
jgi:hypothetical protein